MIAPEIIEAMRIAVRAELRALLGSMPSASVRPQAQDHRWMTISEVARHCRKSRQTVRQAIATGLIKPRQRQRGRRPQSLIHVREAEGLWLREVRA